MRPLEYLLSFTLIIGYCYVFIPRIRSLRWVSYVLFGPIAATLVQLVFEGYRWQLVPAYAMSLAFVLVWGVLFAYKKSIRIGRVLNIVGALLGFLALVVSIVLPALMPVFSLPEPTVRYGVGTATYHWTDNRRRELFSSNPDDRREIAAQVWYPTNPEQSSQKAPYIQDVDMTAPALARLFNFPGFLFDHFEYTKSHATAAAPISTDKQNYPVLVFLSGLNGYRQMNTFQVENMVSQGYIVVGLDQPGTEAAVKMSDGSAIFGRPRDEAAPLARKSADPQMPTPTVNGVPLPNGIIPYLAKDVSFAIDELTSLNGGNSEDILAGKLDLSRLGTFGVSLGGMNVAQACHDDARLKACLVMDVYMPTDVVKDGLKQPTMFMTRNADDMRLERARAGGWSEADIALTIDTMKTTYDKLRDNGYYLDISGMFHLNFTDIPAWSPVTSWLGLTGPIDNQRGFDIVNEYTLAFFDKELRGKDSTLLGGNSATYLEVTFQAKK